MATAHRTAEGTWRTQVYLGKDDSGKRQYRSITARTRRDAEREAAQLLAELEEARMIKEAGTTVGEAAEQYLLLKCNVLEASTATGYRKIIKWHFTDNLKAIPLSLLTQEDVQRWINDLAETHSPKTCANAHGFLTAILRLKNVPLQLHTTLPSRRRKEIYVPDETEVHDILQMAKDTRLFVPVLLATQCGLRASEISGLMLSCVRDSYIRVVCARVDTDHGPVLKGTKSEAGTRDVPIIPEIAEILKTAADADGHICNMTVSDMSSAWGKFRTKQGLPKALNFHALRHHYASKCLLHDIPQRYAAELMGHSTTAMLERVYQHTFPSARNKFADMMRQSAQAAVEGL